MEKDTIFQLLRDLREGQLETKGSLGKLEKGQEELHSYIESVAINQRESVARLDAHKDDDGAHGLKTMRRVWGSMATLITAGLAVIEAWRIGRR